MKHHEERPPTILIVEDIEWIRSGMKKFVELCGYRVAEATDDAQALEVAERESPDLILTEEAVPTFEGLTARLREHPSLNSIPVVIINPDAEEGARHFDAYLLTDYTQIATLLISLRH